MTQEQIKQMLAIQFEVDLCLAKLQTYHYTFPFDTIKPQECLRNMQTYSYAYRAALKEVKTEEQ